MKKWLILLVFLCCAGCEGPYNTDGRNFWEFYKDRPTHEQRKSNLLTQALDEEKPTEDLNVDLTEASQKPTEKQTKYQNMTAISESPSVKVGSALVELARKVRPAVILIETFDRDNNPIGQGTGFFINEKGHLITNLHVIEGAHLATAKVISGGQYPVEGILATDVDLDIVKLLVKVNGGKTPFITPVSLLPSVGEDIMVVGNPFGLESTVSKGIVSAVRRIPALGHILQISAPISPGSSGSPVLNMKGQVIGVATLMLAEEQALNFAVPSEGIQNLSTEGQLTKLSEYANVVTDDAQVGDTSPFLEGRHNSITTGPYLYHNTNGHFSIILPSGWEEIPEDVIDTYVGIIEIAAGKQMEVKYEAAFQKTSSEYFSYPYALVQIEDAQGASWNVLQKFFKSYTGDKILKDVSKETSDVLGKLLEDTNVHFSHADTRRHIVFFSIESAVIGVGEILGRSAAFVGRECIIIIHFYSLKDHYESDLLYFDKIVDSFEYDIGYEYIEAVEGSSEINVNVIAPIVFILCVSAIFVTVVISRGISEGSLDRSKKIQGLLNDNIIVNFERAGPDKNPKVGQQIGSLGDRNTEESVSEHNESLTSKIEVCKNCERRIGKLEKTFLFNGNIVCFECYESLKEPTV